MSRTWLRAALAAAILTGACSGSSTPGRLSIAVIPKGTSHAFWQSIHAGALKAASELDVDIAWRGPLREDDRDAQVAEIENAVGRGASGIVLAPLDDAAMVAPVSAAMRQKIPVVIIDSGSRARTTSASSLPTTKRAGAWAARSLRRYSAAKAVSSCSATPRAATARRSAKRDSSAR